MKCVRNLLCYLCVVTTAVQQYVGRNTTISVEMCDGYRLLVAASEVFLLNSCLLLGYSALNVAAVVVALGVHRLTVKNILIPVAPV